MGVNVSYNAGGVVGEVKKIGSIKGFPENTQPFNEMVITRIPAASGDVEIEYVTPPDDVEILAITVTCSGYGETDTYDMFVGDRQWFKNWALSEVKEGLFLGSSTFVYKTESETPIRLVFHNNSGTSKTVWFGIRMLVKE